MATFQFVQHFLLNSYIRPISRLSASNKSGKRKSNNQVHSGILDGNWEESYFLYDQNLTLNGIVLNDSIALLETKRNKSLKQFQIQFKGDIVDGKSGENCCQEFISLVSDYITINSVQDHSFNDRSASLPLMQCNNKFIDRNNYTLFDYLAGLPATNNVNVSQTQQSSNNNCRDQVTSVDRSNFPAIKDMIANLLHCTAADNDDLSHLINTDGTELIKVYIKNLLLDENFPAFVELVEKELKKLADYV
ncbi:uncharacterized protein TRIADDRAFT_58925 [Trichoplax adhaerens]|uniref:Uncharacterized protein n=1 Tax=Trichoplax adhaerens TaxID=10228 RepID=B3S421_TRIAD|nr:predicted protein [Trichoplax adhaerens]EDV22384.1 predicted protein [Trichoplax adhaerens]|eukprot:XP_002114928.1 predicted protein [Trichoplax adhaerens]